MTEDADERGPRRDVAGYGRTSCVSSRESHPRHDERGPQRRDIPGEVTQPQLDGESRWSMTPSTSTTLTWHRPQSPRRLPSVAR
jgi:hypothetical protein